MASPRTDIDMPFEEPFPLKLDALILGYTYSTKELMLIRRRSQSMASKKLRKVIKHILKKKWPDLIDNLKDIIMIRLSQFSTLENMGMDEKGYRSRCYSIRSELLRLIEEDIATSKESALTADCIHHCFIYTHSFEKKDCATLLVQAIKNDRRSIVKLLMPYADIILGRDWVTALIEGTQFLQEIYNYDVIDRLQVKEMICLRLSHEEATIPYYSKPLTPLMFVTWCNHHDLIEQFSAKYPDHILDTLEFLNQVMMDIEKVTYSGNATENEKMRAYLDSMRDKIQSGKFYLFCVDHINRTQKIQNFTETDKHIIQSRWLKTIQSITQLPEILKVYADHHDALYLNFKRVDSVVNKLNYGLSFFYTKEFYTQTRIKFIEALQERACQLIDNSEIANNFLKHALFSSTHTEHGVTEKYREHLKLFSMIYNKFKEPKSTHIIMNYF